MGTNFELGMGMIPWESDGLGKIKSFPHTSAAYKIL